MSDDITGDLDLLGDWLDAKGYTEEAGLCTRAMDEINKLREERHELKNELAKWVHYWRDKDLKAVKAENEKLRAALKPFAELGMQQAPGSDGDTFIVNIPKAEDLRAAAAALKETE